jgi:hypothetical protein
MRKSAFQPRIPSRGTTVPAEEDWLHEIKHDGYRLIVQRDGQRVRLFTRNEMRHHEAGAARSAGRLVDSAVIVAWMILMLIMTRGNQRMSSYASDAMAHHASHGFRIDNSFVDEPLSIAG